MTHHPVLNTIRHLISEGETSKAIQNFIQHLESENSFPEVLRALLVIQANFNAVVRKESNGILSFSEARSEFAKVNNAVLEMLDQVLIGASPAKVQSKKWWYGGGLLLLLGIAIGWWIIQKSSSSTSSEALNDFPCPTFNAQGKRVMVLAFQKLGGEDSRPELSLQTRIRDLTEKNNLETDVKVVPSTSSSDIRPGNAREGAELGRKCQADLIIWGEYEKFKDSISVDIRYTFTDLNWPAGIAANTFKNVSEIKSDQMKISNIDEAVLRLCTALALHENRMDLAEKWLKKQPNATTRETTWKKQLEEAKK
ncbi:MAG: hypothetical protein JNN28_05390 [Saprospiraceae bacterium]|nr:hypothetical protein [Saprospiraceae bacterium]